MTKKVKNVKKKMQEKPKETNGKPAKKEETALVVVKKKKLDLDIIREKEVFRKTVKTLSLAFIGTIVIAYIALMVLVATSIFYVSHLQNGLIQQGVFVAGISVADMSVEDAVNLVSAQLNEQMPEQMILRYQENTYGLNLQDLEPKFDVESAVSEAYSIGRTKHVVKDLWEYAEAMKYSVNLDCELQYHEENLNQLLFNLAEQLPDKVQEYSYQVENDVLTINCGKRGIALDEPELKNRIVAQLQEKNYEEIEIPTLEVLPKEIDLQAIHDEIYCEPQDAYVTENPLTIHPEKIGVDFDVEKAQRNIDIVPNSEQYAVDLILTNPAVFVKDLNIFPDRLSTFSTNYVNNANRTTNLILASNKINGKVLLPGETFSFNQVVGERTIAAGYKNAAIFVNGQVEDGLAGGICQVSSTLYDAVVGANLKVTKRQNHSMLTSYLAGGKDATVVWGRYDFQFVNNREYPIKIGMSVQGGVITATIDGIRSNEEYEITIESRYVGMSGAYKVYNAYKVYRQNGVEVKREFLSRDLYK